MNWNEYKALAIRTESVPANNFGMVPSVDVNSMYEAAAINAKATRLLHATMGVCTELAELVDGEGTINLIEEIGDVLWYLAIAADTIDWAIDSTGYLDKQPLHWLGELNDVMKRHIFYGTAINISRMAQAFNNIFIELENTLNLKGFTLEMAMEANIRKLEKRFPDKMFTSQAAIHRDVDRELDHILESGELIPKVNVLSQRTAVAIKFADLCNGVQLKANYTHPSEFPDREGISQLVLDYLGVSREEALEELGFTLESCDVNLTSSEELGTVLTIKMAPEPKVELTEAKLNQAQWKAFVLECLSTAQIERMAMDLVSDKSKAYYDLGADELARAMGALYRTYSSRGDKLEDSTVWVIWNELGYSLHKSEVRDKLQRWT